MSIEQNINQITSGMDSAAKAIAEAFMALNMTNTNVEGVQDDAIVRDADPFGKRDSSAAIQEALDSGRPKVLLPQGNFLLENTLRMDGYQTLGSTHGAYGTSLRCVMPGPAITGYKASRSTIRDLSFLGSPEKVIDMVHSPYSRIMDCSFSMNSSVDTFIHMSACWNSSVTNVFAYCAPGPRNLIHLGGAMHCLNVTDLVSVAATTNGILSSIDPDDPYKEVSAAMTFANITAQRHKYGMSLEQGRGVSVNGLYTEATEVALRLGTATRKVTGLSILAGRSGSTLGGPSYAGNKDGNTTGIIEAINCAGVEVMGYHMSDVEHPTRPVKGFCFGSAPGFHINRCFGHNQNLMDWSRNIVRWPAATFSVQISANGRHGDENLHLGPIDVDILP